MSVYNRQLTSIGSRALLLFVCVFITLVALFVHVSTQGLQNKRSVDSIYKLNQQNSIVNHIYVLARYFYEVPETTQATIDPLAGASSFDHASARNELRDLIRQLEYLDDRFSSDKDNLPTSVYKLYFTAEGSLSLLLESYIANAHKLSQISKDQALVSTHYLTELEQLKPRISQVITSATSLYYQNLVDTIEQQSHSYWWLIIAVFLAFSIAIFLVLLRPLQRDVTAAQAEAELANRIKTEFLTSVSHEIRTPMHGIISAGENLESTHLDNKQNGYVRTILSSAESLLDVINDILGYSSLESGDTHAEISRFNLFDTTNDLVQIMEERAQIKNLDLILRYEEGVPHEVGGDSSLIRQVLYHLISNAIKFTEEGYIVVTVDAVDNDDNQDLALKFSIEDTGIGIDDDKLALIFEQFVQGQGGTTRHFGGTGLGLSICKKLVQLMGGEIKVGSVVGEGSTFSFVLPMKHAEDTLHADLQTATVFTGSILFISDDNSFKSKVLSELGMAGFQVECKDSADFISGLKQARENTSLIAIDYFVKSVSPARMASAIKESGFYSNCPAVCITRKHDSAVAQNLMTAGYQGVFSIPSDSDAFTDFIMRSGNRPVTTPLKTSLKTQPSAAANAVTLQGAEILLVEDNRINAALAEDMLLDFGAVVTHAENGKVAVDLIKEGRVFDLVLMDCMMPVMDGFQATRSIRELPQTIGESLPIIALTANAMVGDKERCLEAGMNAYLSKPVRKKDLQSTLHRWMQYHHKNTTKASHASAASPEPQNYEQVVQEAHSVPSSITPSTDMELQSSELHSQKPQAHELQPQDALRHIQPALKPQPTVVPQTSQPVAQAELNAASPTLIPGQAKTGEVQSMAARETPIAEGAASTTESTEATPPITPDTHLNTDNVNQEQKVTDASKPPLNAIDDSPAPQDEPPATKSSKTATANLGATNLATTNTTAHPGITTIPPASDTDNLESPAQAATKGSSAAISEPVSKVAQATKNQAAQPVPEDSLQYLDQVAVNKAKHMMKKRFPTMIEYYLEDTQNYIEQINRGIEAANYAQLVVPAHTIKSSSRQMGAFAVSDLGKEVEALARAEEVSFETLSGLVEELQEQFDLSRIDFNYLLSEAR